MGDKAWDYLEREPADDAPISDNPSGLYCPSCRSVRAELGIGGNHCQHPEYCGGMRRMKSSGERTGTPIQSHGELGSLVPHNELAITSDLATDRIELPISGWRDTDHDVLTEDDGD